MEIKIDKTVSTSFIQQLFESISQKIDSGELTKGEPLPSIRSLAKQTGVSMVTVSKTYNALEEEGWITTVRGKGSFVLKEKDSIQEEETVIQNNRFDWQHNIKDYLPGPYHMHLHHRLDSFGLASSNIHPSLLPGEFFTSKLINVLRQEAFTATSYGEVKGDKGLREEIATFLSSSGMNTSREEVIVTNGVQHGIDLVARTFLGNGDTVLAESPANPAAIAIFRSRGVSVLSIPQDENGLQTDILARLCEKKQPKLIYTCPNYQNPSGVVLNQKRREALIGIADKYECLILEEDSWSEFYYNSPPPSPIKSIDKDDNVIYLKAISNLLSPESNVAAMAANTSLLNRLLVSKQITEPSSALLMQKAVLQCLQAEDMQHHTENIGANLSLRCNMVLELLREHLPRDVTWIAPSGGFFLWITCPYWFNSDQFYLEAKSQGILIKPGSSFYPTEPEYNQFRISFASQDEKQLKDGVILLCKVLNKSLINQYNSCFYAD